MQLNENHNFYTVLKYVHQIMLAFCSIHYSFSTKSGRWMVRLVLKYKFQIYDFIRTFYYNM